MSVAPFHCVNGTVTAWGRRDRREVWTCLQVLYKVALDNQLTSLAIGLFLALAFKFVFIYLFCEIHISPLSPPKSSIWYSNTIFKAELNSAHNHRVCIR